ncbi:hypothetical protein AVEN_60705-1, partial [Araneus ventricosus]
LATTLGSGVYALIAVAAHDHAGPSVVLSILMAAVTSCLGGENIDENIRLEKATVVSSVLIVGRVWIWEHRIGGLRLHTMEYPLFIRA